jgi:hypothetical protein
MALNRHSRIAALSRRDTISLMNSFLFDEFMLWIWFAWSLLTIVNGYLIADGFDSVEETLGFFATIGLIGGGLSLFSERSFIGGAVDWMKSIIMGFLIIPLLPCLYLLPVGWRLGNAFELDLMGKIGVTAFTVLSIGLSLIFFWVASLRILKRTQSPLIAAVMSVFVFAIGPAAAISVAG